MELDLNIEMDPIPKARMTRYSKKSRSASRTLSYQKALAWEINKRLLETDVPGPREIDPTSAAPTSLAAAPSFYELSATFTVTHNRRADLDNYLKALKDALKWSGLIKDDSQIISYGVCKLIKQAPAGSVRIALRTIDPGAVSLADKSKMI